MKWEGMVIPGLIIISLLVIIFSFGGLVDINPVTTRALLVDRASYVGKEVTLRNVAVTGVKYKKLNDEEIFLTILATNTQQTFSQPENPEDIIKIMARASIKPTMSSGLIAHSMFGQDIERRWWFPYLEIKVKEKYNVLTTMPESTMDYGSLLTTPYDLTMKLSSQWFSLQISVFIALLVQLIVSLIVGALVFVGVIIVFPVPK